MISAPEHIYLQWNGKTEKYRRVTKVGIEITGAMLERAIYGSKGAATFCPLCQSPGVVATDDVKEFLDTTLNGAD